jgi:hypothetical protein
MAELTSWLLFKTPTIDGDDGAFLMAALFIITVLVAGGLIGIAYIMTGSLDVNDNSGRGNIK